MKAIVISIVSGNAFIKDIISNNKLIAKLKGNVRLKEFIYAGDYVEYIYDGSTALITNVLERKNYIIRPKISNIDNLFIVQSIIEPKYNISQLFKYHTFFKMQGIKNIYFIMTKTDIIRNNNNDIDFLKNEYLLNIFDYRNQNDLKQIKEILSDKINCFVGQSGVGKSTFLNFLVPELNIKTNEISKMLNRGKHTTTSTTLYEYQNGYIVDTPGFSTIDIHLTKEELAKIFFNFDELYQNCKFSNCLHKNEIKCNIKEKVNEGKILNKNIYDEYLKISENMNK